MKILSFIVIAFLLAGNAEAQLNLYSRITDPRALARLDGPDSEPLRYSISYGYPRTRDSADGSFIIAADSGSGIITHIWFITNMPDSTTHFKLYIDDRLVLSTTYVGFFDSSHGFFHAPFDTTYPPVAKICDVQIPYKKNFKITFIGGGLTVYYAIAWRPVSDSSLVPPFQLNPPYARQVQQNTAERIHDMKVPLWANEKPNTFSDTLSLDSATSATVLDIKGPAMIQTVHFEMPQYNFDELDSLWLDIYWDGAPVPAVHVPVSDFFCSSNSGIPVYSYAIRRDSSGLTCYFPMPFAVEARIMLRNIARRSLPSIHAKINYSREAIDNNKYGYFHAYFSESNPTHYHIYHPVLHEHGRGKFVGMYFTAPFNNTGAILEGDPVFIIDSNPRNNFRYTGGEDYYNSAWWFWGIQFSKPFAGHVNFIKSFYRFHILDAVDFTRSFDFLLQPGTKTDVEEDFRTTAYYYKHWTPFWVSRDTIKAGERWNVAGAGYAPNSPIIAKFDGTQTIFTTTANASGEFNAVLVVPNSSQYGARMLSINDEIRPEPIYVLAAPTLRQIADSLPVTLRYRDSLLVSGTGFDPGEKIQIFLDSILLSGTDTIIVGNDYRFFATVRMPNVAEWKYHLRAVGDHYHEALSGDLITITRIRPFEFEDIVPYATIDSGKVYSRNLSEYWGSHFSHSAVAIVDAKGPGKQARFKFYIPASDTFDVLFLYTTGPKCGNYRFSFDGNYGSSFKGYAYHEGDGDDDVYTSDTISLGKIFFAKDTHAMIFTCLGKDSAGKGYRLGADLLLLTPTTIMPLPKGVFTTPKSDSVKSLIDSPEILNSYIVDYPNPASGMLTLGVNFLPGITDGIVDISLSDILGKKRLAQYSIPIGINGGIAHFDTHTLPTGNYIAEFIIRSGSDLQRISRLMQIRE